jgi:hypothetical protein
MDITTITPIKRQRKRHRQDVLRLWDFMLAMHAETGEAEAGAGVVGEEESLHAVVAAVAVAMVGERENEGLWKVAVVCVVAT